jgi:hypothetical protein
MISQKIYDPIKKGDVYGNVLDQAANPTYNVKLYMMSPLAAGGTTSNNTISDGDSARTPTATGSTDSGSMWSSMRSDPKNTVVLAQTGVTGTQIDNLEITTVQGTNTTSIITTKVNFDVIQPGAADFLDQIVAAKMHLGIPLSNNDTPIFLEVIFKGYSADIDDEDLGGEPVVVSGPFVYGLIISRVALEIDEEGSSYTFECVPVNTFGYSDTNFCVPVRIETEGSTIEEHIAHYAQIVNDYTARNLTDYEIVDLISIDISGLKKSLNSKYGLSDLSITLDSDEQAEEINRIMNPELKDKTREEYAAILADMEKDEGSLDIVVARNKITVRPGITVERYIQTLLSMNDEFFNKLTRKINPSDPTSTDVDKDLPFVNWFKVNAGVEYMGFDYVRNCYAKKIIFKPVIFATSGVDVQISPQENQNLTPEQMQTRLDWMNPKKSYHYIFTGLNDQILGCNLKYNAGQILLMPPAGGVTGEVSTVLAKNLTSEASVNTDVTHTAAAAAALQVTEKKKANKILDTILGKATDADVRSIANILNFNPVQIADAVINRNGINAQVLKDALANKAIAQSILDIQIQQLKRNTSSDNFVNPDGTPYNPVSSGYTYSEDLLQGFSERLSTELRVEAVREQTRQQRAEAAKARDAGPVQPAQEQNTDAVDPQITQVNLSNRVEDATYDGTPRNTLFGYITQQHHAADFLLEIDLEIKGDPWYLGAPVDQLPTASTPGSELVSTVSDEYVNFDGDAVFVLFDLQSPRRYDFDVSDEDNNTGYWDKHGTAYFISGVYRLIGVVHNFSGGMFSQKLNMKKETPMKTSQMGSTAQGSTE